MIPYRERERRHETSGGRMAYGQHPRGARRGEKPPGGEGGRRLTLLFYVSSTWFPLSSSCVRFLLRLAVRVSLPCRRFLRPRGVMFCVGLEEGAALRGRGVSDSQDGRMDGWRRGGRGCCAAACSASVIGKEDRQATTLAGRAGFVHAGVSPDGRRGRGGLS
jgi:hypothetical protein